MPRFSSLLQGPMRRFALLASVLLPLLAPAPHAWSASEVLAAAETAAAVGSIGVAASKAPPVFDRNMMVFGCMGGLMVGALSTLLPPVAGWAVAGVWMGGLGTMVVRATFGCAYGALAGAVASAAHTTYLWLEAHLGRHRNQEPPVPLPIEGASGS